MAYFDSPKNRALWNRQLDTLREAREARAAGLDGHAGEKHPSAAAERQHDTPNRVRVSYNQLVMEERNDRQRRMMETRTAPVRTHEKEAAMAGPQR